MYKDSNMMTSAVSEYQHLCLSQTLLNLNYTLTSGQAFRWRLDEEGFWGAPVKGQIIRIREDDSDGFVWQTYPDENNFDLVRSYFRLDDDVEQIYHTISKADPNVARLVAQYRGLRFLRQEPEETILSFVCSAANSIPRIMVAVEKLSEKYGSFIGEMAGRKYYSFPPASVLAGTSVDDLANTASLGFRGANLNRVAGQLVQKGPDWLPSLRDMDYRSVRAELMSLQGIGPKIADCVCLFALDKDEAVPVDTHIRQVAARLYLSDMKAKSVTAGVYDKVINAFQERFGKLAGWAQQFLYMEDIKRH